MLRDAPLKKNNWLHPTLYEAIMAVLTETMQCHLYPPSSIKTTLNQSLSIPTFVPFSIYQSPPQPLLRSVAAANQSQAACA